MTEVSYLSLIIPAFNEEKKIEHDLGAAIAFLKGCDFSWEIIVVDDGSQDRTSEVAQTFKNALDLSLKKHLHLIRYEKNQGKGFAIKTGVAQARGERIAFVDSGLCVPYHFLMTGLKLVDNGAGCALGSRRHSESTIQVFQPFYRRVGSKVFNILMRWLLGISVRDTQCGFKIYEGHAARTIFPLVETKGFMFDIEVLMRFRKMHLNLVEFPVVWSSDADTRYRPFWGTIINIFAILRIWIRCSV